MTQNYVITISRQYGSGGRTIGKMLSERLGIPYYDRDLLKLAAEESGINQALFEKTDERVKSHPLLFKITKNVYNGELIPPDSDQFTSDTNLFNYQAKVIKKLAEAGEPCIIIGRCADYILRDYDNVLSVFIHAPKEYCLKKASEKHANLSLKEVEKLIESTDKYRSEYYRYHTGWNWIDARNYDLCLNSSKLGFERCVDEIVSYRNVRFS